MKRLMCLTLLIIFLLSATAQAASFNVAVSRQDDGTTLGELWYNGKMIWRLKVCGDGSQPVSGQTSPNTTVVVPDVVGGMFRLKINNQ